MRRIFFVLEESDRDDCYHDEDAESIDEDIIDEIQQIYDEILEKKVPTYPYENYPDLSLGDFVSAEFEQYIQLKKLTLDENELDELEKVIDWLTKQHPYLNTISCNKLTDVSVQGHIKNFEINFDCLYFQDGILSNVYQKILNILMKQFMLKKVFQIFYKKSLLTKSMKIKFN